MKAPKINAYYVDKISGAVLLELEFDLEGQRVTELKPLSGEVSATNYLAAVRRKWFMDAFENWINHKRHIIEASSSQEKREVLNTISAGYQKMITAAWALPRIAEAMLKGKAKIEYLLPNPENKSYESSQRNLQEIFLFCANEVNQPIK